MCDATGAIGTAPGELHRKDFVLTDWDLQLRSARQVARLVGDAVRSKFGLRSVSAYRGQNDVQLHADMIAHRMIVDSLSEKFPDYGIVSEEGDRSLWPEKEFVWVVDPLDGTNNFGYGIAHCAIAITLFHWDRVVLALVADPLMKREFYATEYTSTVSKAPCDIPLRRATISLVTNYSEDGREWGNRMAEYLGPQCKRTLSLWAPALDLALVADGALDAVVCHRGYPIDICGGIFLVMAAGGTVLDLDGEPLRLHRSRHAEQVSFVAARTPQLGKDLLGRVRSAEFIT